MSDEGRTYRVRNTYGYVEHLTEREITSLLRRGEDITVVDPDWREGSEDGGRKPVSRLVKGIFSTLFAVHGAYSEPQQHGGATQHKWSEAKMQEVGDAEEILLMMQRVIKAIGMESLASSS